MKEKLGIPYMGSKRAISKKIVDFIIEQNPNAKYIYDVFGGGCSISFEFVQREQIKKVFYNELNTGIVSLLVDIRDNKVTEKYFNFVDRETFLRHKDDDDWFGGLCKTCYSFGNNQIRYLFGELIEKDKELLHNIVVSKDKKLIKEFYNKFGILFEFNGESLHERRIKTRRIIKNSNSDNPQIKKLIQL